jgi:glutamate---cysteine ligase / carboxylate-amine ligase
VNARADGGSRLRTVRTVGVEEELLLIDAESGAPTAVAQAVLHPLPGYRGADVPGALEAELQQQQVELETAPTTDLAELGENLRRWRRAADERARFFAARVAALATSPLPVVPELTPSTRYQRMAEHLGLTATEQLTCGCHVHVGIEDEDEGVAIMDRIRIWLPILIAISANSPFWQGRDTDYASFRSQAWTRFPTAGPTELFGTAQAYTERAEALVSSGVLLDHAMIYFDARLSHRYPTIEIRAADVCLYADDSVVVAGIARALVETAAREAAAGNAPASVPGELLRLANWRAGRSGLADELLDPYCSRPRPADEVLRMLLDHLRPALRDAGDEDVVVDGLARIQSRGVGSAIQRKLWSAAPDLGQVARSVAELTLAGSG